MDKKRFLLWFNKKEENQNLKWQEKLKFFCFLNAKNKFTGINISSCRKLANMISKKFKIKVFFVPVNNWLKKLLKKPIKSKKTFFLREKDKDKRIDFKEMIKEKNIRGKDIFLQIRRDSF